MKQPLNTHDEYEVPALAEVCTYLCLALLVTPVCPLVYLFSGKNLWFSAFGFKVYAEQNFLFYTVLAIVPWVGGVASLGILRRKCWGLVVGVMFCVVGIVFSATSLLIPFTSSMKHHSPYSEIAVLLLCLLWIVRTLRTANHALLWPPP